MAVPGLGSFSKLPPEIRSLIWNELVPSASQKQKTDLSILRASKQLNTEIIYHLHDFYKSIVFFITSGYDCGFPGFEMSVTELREEEPVTPPMWAFTNAGDAIARGLEYLPLHILPTFVYIEPPNPEDPGQVICLCERLQQLVRLFQRLKKPIKSLTIDLVQGALWVREGSEPRLSFSIPLTYDGDIGLTFIQSDVEAVLFPFHRLQNVQDVQFDNFLDESPNLYPQRFSSRTEWLNHVAESILPDPNPSITERNRKLGDIFYFYIHLKMDVLWGDTACMLRLDRFAYWTERDYEKRFSQLVLEYPVEFQVMDWYKFENTRRRYSFAHILRHFVSGKSWHRLRRSVDIQNKTLEVPVKKWFYTFPDGILPFNCKTSSDDPSWYPFHEYATLMIRETLKRQAHLIDLPPDPFLNSIIEAAIQQAMRKDFEPEIESRLMKEYGIIMYRHDR